MFGVWRWTIHRQATEFQLRDISSFSTINGKVLDRDNQTTGQTLIAGYVKSLGLPIPRSRIRKALIKLHPKSTTFIWGIVTIQTKYFAI